jgi:Mg-chelatase subunit ChlD
MNPHQRKTVLIGVALFAATAGALAYLPTLNDSQTATTAPGNPPGSTAITASQQRQPVVEAVFVLDTTGSMGGLIQAAKDKIWSIAATMAAAEPAPRIRMGLVAYRDRGDDYVTQVVDLTPDLDALHAALFQLQANGGGDGPESVNQALHDAIHAISWGQDANAYRVVFLVGDAPPHMDYQDDIDYPQTLALARQRGIRVNAIQCGNQPETLRLWQQIAQLGNGAYLQVAQDGAAVAIATPLDDKLARLSSQLDDTRIYYGSEAERSKRARHLAASEAVRDAVPAPVLARRAAFAASTSGKAALLGDKELVDEIDSGKVSLDDIDPEELPEPLQNLSRQEQRQIIGETARRRAELQRQIEEVAAERSAYLRKRVASEGGEQDSLERKLFDTVREQAQTSGLRYNADAPVY